MNTLKEARNKFFCGMCKEAEFISHPEYSCNFKPDGGVIVYRNGTRHGSYPSGFGSLRQDNWKPI